MTTRKKSAAEYGGLEAPASRTAPDRRPEVSDEELMRRATLNAARTGLPSMEPIGTVRNVPPRILRADTEPLQIEVPVYLNDALRMAAARRKTTKKRLVLEALKAAGFEVADEDMAEDGRRLRGRRG